VVGSALVLALSASDAAIAPSLMAAFVTSAAEATGVSGNLLPKASKPEAFFPLSDVVGGTLLKISYMGKQQTEGGNTELRHMRDC
jgi:hypothetical protein